MKKAIFLCKLTALMVTLSMVLSLGIGKLPIAAASSVTPSQTYVESIGKGWNLGDNFESFNSDDQTKSDETG